MKKLIFSIILIGLSFCSYSQTTETDKEIPEVYGTRCGIGGFTPELRERFELLLIQNQVETLDKWLNSKNTVRQAYAVEGLIRLHNEDRLILNENQLSKIDKIKNSKKKVVTCSGCSSWEQKIKDVLSEFEIK